MQEKSKREKELAIIIRNANIAWNTFAPIYTDQEYHVLWKELYDLNPNNPELYHTSKDPSIGHHHYVHRQFIPGTQKAFEMLDLKPFLTRYSGQTLLIEPKYDGVAIMIYVDGDGDMQVVLHGDGRQGRDVSYHPWKIEGGPLPPGAYSAEAIIPMSKWSPELGSNPRNTVAGWINRESYCQQIADYVTIMRHDSPVRITIKDKSTTELEDILLEAYVHWKEIYPMDGLMLKVKDPALRVQAGFNDLYYNWSIAWKPPIQSKWTQVEYIDWNVSRHGRVIPTVVYSQIELCGTKNTRVTGLHAKYIEQTQIREDSSILVGKAGEIIPRILNHHNDNCLNEFTLPKVCPICGEPLKWDSVHLVCRNPECMPKLVKTITYFYSQPAMDINGIGEAFIEKLLQDDALRTQLVAKPWLLLTILHNDPMRERIADIIGNNRMISLIDAIEEASGKKDEAHFIAGLGHEFLGYKKALVALQWLRYNEPMSKLAEEMRYKIVLAIKQLEEAKHELLTFKILPPPKPAKIHYVITGTLSSPRNDMIEYLAKFGWQMKNVVTSQVDYLIQGILKKPSQKLLKAQELGISIIGEHQLPDLLPKNKENQNEGSNT